MERHRFEGQRLNELNELNEFPITFLREQYIRKFLEKGSVYSVGSGNGVLSVKTKMSNVIGNFANDPTSPAGAGNKQTRAPGLFNQRRHAAKPCSDVLQLSESDLHQAPRPGPSDPRERFIVTIEAEQSAVPAVVRLRQWLKVGLRGMGLRCVDVRRAETGGRDIAAVNMGKVAGDGE